MGPEWRWRPVLGAPITTDSLGTRNAEGGVWCFQPPHPRRLAARHPPSELTAEGANRNLRSPGDEVRGDRSVALQRLWGGLGRAGCCTPPRMLARWPTVAVDALSAAGKADSR